jgi:hypothetical protein
METTLTVLVTPKSLLKMFVLASDRDYFARPIAVVLSSEVASRQLMATDPQRGTTFPVNPKHVKATWQLSQRKRAALAR